MKIENYYNYKLHNPNYINNCSNHNYKFNQIKDKVELNFVKNNREISFGANPVKAIKDFGKYIKVRRKVLWLNQYLKTQPNSENFPFRNLSMEFLEGIQYGIKVFKGLTMKDIQYLSENLHVIAVKRGCNNMCGYCYADAKPSKREMSWEDFTLITGGFKTLRKRLGSLPLFGENLPISKEDIIYRTTEVFYDADCMNIAIKDKKGKIYDMRDLITEVYNSLGRKSCFDTSGWNPDNKLMQKRAEKYAQYFSEPQNMNKLNAFNLSFNPFNASFVAGVKALKANDFEKYQRLRNRFTDRIANAIFTFTPLLKYDNFGIMVRSFGLNAKNADYFNYEMMFTLIQEVISKAEALYKADLNGLQKFVKTPEDVKKYMTLVSNKLNKVDTSLNISGRMKQFMETFKIKDNLKTYDSWFEPIYKDLTENGRYHKILAHRLIDADGKVYHMNYAMFFPTEIQLNIKDKTPTPKLANLKEEYLITKEIINKKEELHAINDFNY